MGKGADREHLASDYTKVIRFSSWFHFFMFFAIQITHLDLELLTQAFCPW